MPVNIALALLVQATELPAIKVVSGKDDDLVVEIEPFEERGLAEVKDAAARAMAEACAGRPIGWGNLSYSGHLSRDPAKSTEVVGYRQAFRCLDLDSARYPHAPADWKPAASDKLAASKVFSSYFDARDKGALDQVFAMLEPTSRGSRELWMSNQQIARSLLAGKGERMLTGMRWFNDPPEAPYPGIFVRLTFAAKFAGVPVYCGSMVLYRAASDAYLIGGVQEHLLPERDHPDAQRIAEYQKQFCE